MADATNQCDGCRMGLPVVDGLHMAPLEGGGWYPHMSCTAHRYRDARRRLPPPAAPTSPPEDQP